MKTTIRNDKELRETIESLNLRDAATMQALCIGIVQQAYESGEQECEVHINLKLMSPCYKTNPPLFAQTLADRTPYRFTQAYLDEEDVHTLVLYCGLKHRPITFRAKVLEAVKKFHFFKAHRSHIPLTYRRHPQQITDFLERETGSRVKHLKKPEHIVWKQIISK